MAINGQTPISDRYPSTGEDEYDRKAVEFLSKVGEMACAKALDWHIYK